MTGILVLGKGTKFRRYTMRIDGFVSVHASMQGGEFTTKPLTFEGSVLDLNFSTSVAGGILVEIQYPGGIPIERRLLQSKNILSAIESNRISLISYNDI